jgi:hypothetical protein
MANVLTNVGKAQLVGVLAGTASAPKYLAWGTGTTGSLVTDTALTAEAAEARTLATVSVITTAVTNDTYQLAGTITSLSSQTIAEVGVFDVVTHAAGNMSIHGDFAGIALGINDAIAFIVTLQQS